MNHYFIFEDRAGQWFLLVEREDGTLTTKTGPFFSQTLAKQDKLYFESMDRSKA